MEFNSIQTLITTRLTRAKDQIQARMDNAGVNASGRTRASFQVRNLGNSIQLIGGGSKTAPVGTLEIGRVAGLVPKGFTDILTQWSKDKGLTFDSESDRRSFAYLLGRKIAREGTNRHKQHEEIYSQIVRETQDDLNTAIREELSKQVLKAVTDLLVTTTKTHKNY